MVKRIPVFLFVALGGILSLVMGVVMIVAQDETPAPVGEVTLDPLLLPSATATATWTATPTLMVVTDVVWPTPTLTETPTVTPTLTETPTATPTWTETPTLVPTVTLEPTLLPSATIEPSVVPPTLEPTTVPVKQEQPTQSSPQGYAPLPTTEVLATSVPVVPSAVPVEPTAVPIVPTAVPVEPIVLPTLPPVENPVQPTPVLLTTVVLTQPVEPTVVPVVTEPTSEPLVEPTVVLEPTVESLPLNGQINGQVLLPQRALQAGMSVSLVSIEGQSAIAQTQTDDSGSFQFADVPAGNYVVTVQVSGALALQGTVTVTAGQMAALPLANLVVGDTNGDNVIDLADAAMVAANFNIEGAVPQADLNQDGMIDIRDLTLLGGYFGIEGPLQWE
jgi:hypothetical protein